MPRSTDPLSLLQAAQIELDAGRPGQGLTIAEQALAASQMTADDLITAHCYGHMGLAAARLNLIEKVALFYQLAMQSMARARQRGQLQPAGSVPDQTARFYTRALALQEATHGDPEQAVLLYMLAQSAVQEDRLDEAEQLLARSRQHFQAIPDPVSDGRCAHMLADIAARRGDDDTAERRLRDAIRIGLEHGEQLLACYAETDLGMLLNRSGRHTEASSVLAGALERARTAMDRNAEGKILLEMASAAQGEGARDAAARLLDASYPLLAESGRRQDEAVLWTRYGMIFAGEGDAAQAERHYNEALSICHEIGWKQQEAAVLLNLGMVMEGRDDAAAERRLRESVRAAFECGACRIQAGGSKVLGALLARQSRVDESLEWLQHTLQVYEVCGAPQDVCMAAFELASHLFDTGRPAEAAAPAERALALAKQQGDGAMEAQILVLQGLIAIRSGRAADAPAIFLRASQRAAAAGDLVGSGVAHAQLGMLAGDQGNWREAFCDFRTAEELYQRANAPQLAQVQQMLQTVRQNAGDAAYEGWMAEEERH